MASSQIYNFSTNLHNCLFSFYVLELGLQLIFFLNLLLYYMEIYLTILEVGLILITKMFSE